MKKQIWSMMGVAKTEFINLLNGLFFMEFVYFGSAPHWIFPFAIIKSLDIVWTALPPEKKENVK